MKAANPWAEMDALMNSKAEPTGPEWFTAEQFAERYVLTDDSARKRLARLARGGELDAWKGVCRGNGRITKKYRVASATPVDGKRRM